MKTFSLNRYTLLAGCVAIAACSQPAEFSRLQYTPNINSVFGGSASPLAYSELYSFGRHAP